MIRMYVCMHALFTSNQVQKHTRLSLLLRFGSDLEEKKGLLCTSINQTLTFTVMYELHYSIATTAVVQTKRTNE